jgi:hypothetical protein
MARPMEMIRCVLAGRGVAAADMATHLALPEFDPARAFFQALLTGTWRSRRWEVGRGQVLQMFTRPSHGILHWMLVRIAWQDVGPFRLGLILFCRGRSLKLTNACPILVNAV